MINNLLPLVILVILSIIYVSLQGNNNKIFMMFVLIIAVLYLCFLDTREQYSNYAPIGHKMGSCSGVSLNKGDDINSKHMKYDGLILKSQHREPKPLVSDVTIFSPVGDGIRLRDDIGSERHPTVDGIPGKPQKMFMLAHNQCSMDCCPSAYSCDRGCVCMTDEQKAMIQGKNKKQVAPGDCRWKV